MVQHRAMLTMADE